MLAFGQDFRLLDVDAEPPCYSSFVFVFCNVYAFFSYIVFVIAQYIKILGADAWSLGRGLKTKSWNIKTWIAELGVFMHKFAIENDPKP